MNFERAVSAGFPVSTLRVTRSLELGISCPIECTAIRDLSQSRSHTTSAVHGAAVCTTEDRPGPDREPYLGCAGAQKDAENHLAAGGQYHRVRN